MNLAINFGNLEQELKNKEITIEYHNIGIYLIDKNGIVYQIESYFYGSYVDKLIENNRIVIFYRVPTDSYEFLSFSKKRNAPVLL